MPGLVIPLLLADLEIGALTIRAEARGETLEGQVAVAHVIINRVKARHRRESTISGVCLEPLQFSAWNLDDPNRAKMGETPWSDDTLLLALAALLRAIDEDRRGIDPTEGALHYHTKNARPRWSRGIKPTVVIGHHQFYAGIP